VALTVLGVQGRAALAAAALLLLGEGQSQALSR
jgi:hypothetical protein